MMTKEDNEHFENSTRSWICDNDYIDDNTQERDHFHITRKYSCSAHKDYYISVKLNHKNPVAFHNLKNYDFHLIIQRTTQV